MPRVSSRGRRKSRKQSAAPVCGVLDHPQGSVSSTSCLPLQAFPSLQFFASISVFNFLHRFWLSWKPSFPLLYPPHGLRIPLYKADWTFFLFFLFLGLLIFCCFFGLLFHPFLVIWRSPGDPQIKPKLVKTRFGKGFLEDFHFCANFCKIFIDFSSILRAMDAHFSYSF